MKNLLCAALFYSAVLITGQGKKFYEKGEVDFKQRVERINMRFENNLPFVKVTIRNKTYTFLFDSGAPTVISQAIFRELNLKKKYRRSVGDSNKNTQEQIFTELPEMKIDQVTFRNTGAVVLDLNADELRCLHVDGIIGANQMAGLVWRLNYAENQLEVAKDISGFDLRGFDLVIPFGTSIQKTPLITIRMFDKDLPFTFDTGFSGRLELTEVEFNPGKVQRSVRTSGTHSTGAFGTAKPSEGYIFRAQAIGIGNSVFKEEIVSTGSMNLIGNEFFRDFTCIMDWKSRRIYMKRMRTVPAMLESFGFSYRFLESKPVVAYVIGEDGSLIRNGDIILAINGISLEHLDQDQVCHYFLHRIESNQRVINIKIDRGGKVFDYQIERKTYLN